MGGKREVGRAKVSERSVVTKTDRPTLARRKISEDDLRRLSVYLDELCLAYSQRNKTGEREAYQQALSAVLEILNCVGALYAGNEVLLGECRRWFDKLRRMLEDLDIGIVSPVIDCPTRRKGLPTDTWMARAAAVIAIEELRRLGMKLDPAAQKVIGLMPHLGASPKDLRTWRSEFGKGKVRNHCAQERYEFSMEWLRRASKIEIQRDVDLLYKLGCESDPSWV